LINLYTFGTAGAVVMACDIIRIIAVFVIAIGALNYFNEAKASLHATERDIAHIALLVFHPTLLTSLIMIILYIYIFAKKFTYLNQDLGQYLDLDLSKDYARFKKFEFFSIVDNFESVLLLESILLFAIIARYLFVMGNIKRINTFFQYLTNSFKAVIAYWLIIILFAVFFSIFANNIFGELFFSFSSFGNAFVHVLLFSIGHLETDIFYHNDYGWSMIWVFLFYFVFIYFFLNNFIGIFLEEYRIISLKKGYSYERRKHIDDDDLSHMKKKKKVAN
jgi:hypothetical protein